MGSKQGQFSLLGTHYDPSACDITRFICWLTVPKNLLELKAKFKLMLQSFYKDYFKNCDLNLFSRLRNFLETL